jgi:hypothetical protein
MVISSHGLCKIVRLRLLLLLHISSFISLAVVTAMSICQKRGTKTLWQANEWMIPLGRRDPLEIRTFNDTISTFEVCLLEVTASSLYRVPL